MIHLMKISRLYFLMLGLLGSTSSLFANRDWPKITKLEDGCYQFDGVIIDKKNLQIKFEMISNQRSGLIEYGIVHESGKIHESLFRTKTRPEIIHASLLLLKAKAVEDYFQSENNYSNIYSASCVDVHVVWESNQSLQKSNIRKLYYNHNSQGESPRSPIFLFTGSRLIESTFMAEHTGSILGIYLDPDAILNSIESGSDNDDLWMADKFRMPPLEKEVTCVLQLPRLIP